MFYTTNRWFLVPCSYRGLPRSRRGQSQRSSGQSWTLSRNLLSSEPDTKEMSCWSSEVCTVTFASSFPFPSHCNKYSPPCLHTTQVSLRIWFFIWSCVVTINSPLVCPCPSREELGCCSADCRMFRCAFAGSVPLSMAHDLEHWNKVNLPWYHHICTSIISWNCFAPPESWSFCPFLFKLYKSTNMSVVWHITQAVLCSNLDAVWRIEESVECVVFFFIKTNFKSNLI